jgi:excisionase family DNA binding protein
MSAPHDGNGSQAVDASPDIGLLTAGQVAKLLGVPTSWVYAKSREGRLPTVRLGRYYRYRAATIRTWLAEQER